MSSVESSRESKRALLEEKFNAFSPENACHLNFLTDTEEGLWDTSRWLLGVMARVDPPTCIFSRLKRGVPKCKDEGALHSMLRSLKGSDAKALKPAEIFRCLLIYASIMTRRTRRCSWTISSRPLFLRRESWPRSLPPKSSLGTSTTIASLCWYKDPEVEADIYWTNNRESLIQTRAEYIADGNEARMAAIYGDFYIIVRIGG